MDKTFGPFTIEKKLGAGAQGEVYLALDGQGRKVALKLLHKQFSGDPEISGRFKRESRISMSVDHPNVVRALDAGEVDGRLYMSCEFVKGGGLDDLLKEEGFLAQDRALKVFRDLLLALDAVHKAGMVHRDVKPANVLLDERGRAKLSDLGLARSTSPARTQYTRTGMVVGSPSFMSPEQIEPMGELDIRCDLYSAGIVLYYILSGCLPFTGQTILNVLRAQLEQPPPRLHDIMPTVSPEISKLVWDLMQKDPDDRPKDPATVLKRLYEITEAAPESPMAEAAFPGTLDGPQEAFPNTLDAAPQAAFPNTLDGPAADIRETSPPRHISATLDDSMAASFPQTIDTPKAEPEKRNLTPASDSAPAGLARAKLTFVAGGSTRVLFVYGGTRLQMGRDGLDRSESEVCLRLRPARGNEDAIRRISGKHLKFEAASGKIAVHDLGSTCGTVVDGSALPKGGMTTLSSQAAVNVAGVMRLEANPVSPPSIAYEIEGKGLPAAGQEGVFVSRPDNGREHAYLLVPVAAALDEDQDDGVKAAFCGSATLVNAGGELWLAGGGLPEDACVALQPGLRFSVGATAVEVGAIEPSDQKG